MKKKLNNDKFFVFKVILFILIFLFLIFCLLNIILFYTYKNVVLPNSLIDKLDISNYSYKKVEKKIDFNKNVILSRSVKLKVNSVDYKYTLKDLGVSINVSKTVNKIKEEQNKLKYSEIIYEVNNKKEKHYEYYYDINKKLLRKYLSELETQVNIVKQDAYFDTSQGVNYFAGTNGFKLDIDKSIEVICQALADGILDNIELIGDVDLANYNEKYVGIDTMTSSFVTYFNEWEGTRPINLKTGVNYLNGAIIEPGAVFSFYDYAGPYNKAGYVFYYEFVGNGICQVATTVYNTALLGGHEIVKRSNHAKKSTYVAGALDATVASYASGWHVDMAFRNTYDYPIYLKAYIVGNEIHIEFWSNSKAKGNRKYQTESVPLGGRCYNAYLHVFENDVWVEKRFINRTCYSEE